MRNIMKVWMLGFLLGAPLSASFASNEGPLDGRWELIEQTCDGVEYGQKYTSEIWFEGERSHISVKIGLAEYKTDLIVSYPNATTVSFEQTPEDQEAARQANQTSLIVDKESAEYSLSESESEEILTLEAQDSSACKGKLITRYKKLANSLTH